MPSRSLLLNLSDPSRGTLLASRSELTGAQALRFFRSGDESFEAFPLDETGRSIGELFRPRDLSKLATLRASVGLKDELPTAGTWSLTVNTTTDDLTALEYDIAEAAMQTALNANSGVTAAGGVTVKKIGNLYELTVTNANTSLTLSADPANLRPSSTIAIGNPVPAAVGVHAVYTLRLLQRVFAGTNAFTVRDPNAEIGAVTASTVGNTMSTVDPHGRVAGDRVRFATTGTLPEPLLADTDYYVLASGLTTTAVQLSRWPDGSAIDITTAGTGTHTMYQRDYGVTLRTITSGDAISAASWSVAISPDPLSGAFRFRHEQQNTTRIVCAGNASVKAVWNISGVSGNTASSSNWNSRYFDFPGTGNATRRFWYNQATTGTAPAIPSGGTRHEIAYPADDLTAEQMLGYLADAMITQGDFTAALAPGAALRVTAAAGGNRSTPSTTLLGASIATLVSGLSGILVGQTLKLWDSAGNVGVYFIDATITTVPAAALACTRQLACTLAGDEDGADTATALAAALAADPDFADSIADGAKVFAIDTASGTRAGVPTSTSPYLSPTVTKPGFANVVTIDRGDGADTIAAKLGTGYTVTDSAEFAWTISRTASGETAVPTVEDDSLAFPIGILFGFKFDQVAVYEAFEQTDNDELTAVFEIKAANTGEDEEIWLQTEVTIVRDLQRAEAGGGPIFAVSDTPTAKWGSLAIAAGNSSGAVVFSNPFAALPTCYASAVQKLDPADDDPPMVWHVSSVSTTGFTITLSAPATDNVKVPWSALLL